MKNILPAAPDQTAIAALCQVSELAEGYKP